MRALLEWMFGLKRSIKEGIGKCPGREWLKSSIIGATAYIKSAPGGLRTFLSKIEDYVLARERKA